MERPATYGEIAGKVSTSPRVVGQAMRRNPTPLVIPCHRIVGKHGIGGFTPSPEIKEALSGDGKKDETEENKGMIVDTCILGYPGKKNY